MKKVIYTGIIVICMTLLCAASITASTVKIKDTAPSDSGIRNVKTYGAVGDGTADDTQAINQAIKDATRSRSTVYFPAGTYLISSTLELKYSYGNNLFLYGESSRNTKIVTKDDFSGDMINSLMRSGFRISNIAFEQNGTGAVIDALFCEVINCSFKNTDKAESDLFTFCGSNCRVVSCSFENYSQDKYALYYSKRHDDITGSSDDGFIAINSYIEYNSFSGTGSGVAITSEAEGERLEGVKVIGNTFTNIGTQIVVETVLSADVSANKMSGSKNAILIRPKGLLVHGLYITGNDISASYAGVMTADGAAHCTIVNVCDNLIQGGKYGFLTKSSIGSLIVNNNSFKDQSSASVCIESKGGTAIVTDNHFSNVVRKADISGKTSGVIKDF